MEVDIIGMSGWTSGDFLNSLDQKRTIDICDRPSIGLRSQLQHKEYQLVMLMIGTNDLGTDIPVMELYENIAKLREVILHYCSRVVLFTLPSFRHSHQIMRINEMIHNFVLEQSSREANTFLFDCHALFHHANILASERAHGPLHEHDGAATKNGKLQHEMVFDFDQLHFTSYGSKLLGETLYSRLSDFGVLALDDSLNQS